MKWLTIWGLLLMSACADSPDSPTRWCDGLPRAAYASLERIPVADDWFEVYRVAPDVLAIYEPFQWQEIISFLILGEERALLVDTGMGISSIRRVVDELTALPVVVINTHTHFDHVGGNHEFEHVLGMDTAYTRRSAEGMSGESLRAEVAPDALCRPLPAGVDATTFSIQPFTITEFIADGHRIDLGGREIEVLSIPGHTPDSIALLDAAAGFLWTGDTFYEGPIWLWVPETDLAAYTRSVERLVALRPGLRMLFPAHNTPTAKPERLEDLRSAWERVEAGEVEGETRSEGRVEYVFDGFSFLMMASR